MNMARLKKMVSFALDPDLLKRIDQWRERQDPPPSKTAVVEAALRAWLDRKKMSHLCPIYEEGVRCPAKWGFSRCVEHRKANPTEAQKRFDANEHKMVDRETGQPRGHRPRSAS
jgi:hypothetical protein